MGGSYLHSGPLRPHAIVVEVQAFPATTDDDQALALPNESTNISWSVAGQGPRSGRRVDDEFPFQKFTYRGTSIACRTGDMLFAVKMSFEQRTPTTEERARGEAALLQIVSSLSAS
ncbi:MAG: hypothetical protein ABI629_10925 [bacterium]